MSDRFSPIDFFILAQKLIENPDYIEREECCFRTSIGRSYYSVYLLVRELVSDKIGGLPPDYGKQKQYVEKKIKIMNPGVGDELKDLKRRRAKADYNIILKIGKKDAEEAKMIAEEIIQDLKEFSR